MMEKKYRLTETCEYEGHVLHRIVALKDFSSIKAGDKGGWIEKEGNLSQNDYCWVYDNAMVYGDAEVRGNAKVTNNRGYIVFKNWWSSGRYFTWTRSNNKWSVGCFYGTGDELIAKAYKDSGLSGREYERIVRYVEDIYQSVKAIN